jgi:hypothetical protein
MVVPVAVVVGVLGVVVVVVVEVVVVGVVGVLVVVVVVVAGNVVVGEPFRALAMAWICWAVREERELIALTLLIPVWIMVAVAPSLAELASGPWQPAQSAA